MTQEEIANKEFYSKLSYDKVKMNWNKNPIKMDLFLSFITIPYTRRTDHLGYENGWTLIVNHDYKLKIHGGVVNGIEYLDSIEFGEKLSNEYNNWVNPFYMSSILTSEGVKFFLEYYKADISEIINRNESAIVGYKNKITHCENALDSIHSEIKKLSNL
jgi:hypothetical protein